jgi:hypothetical protein
MDDIINGKPSANFWIIGGAALFWNLLGLFLYYQNVTTTAADLQQASPEMQDLVLNVPMWATSAYATAVTAGVLGSLLLLMRKSWAVPIFFLSLAGVIVQDFHAFVLKNAYSIIGPIWSAVSLVVFVVAVLLAWYSRQARGRGWLA